MRFVLLLLVACAETPAAPASSTRLVEAASFPAVESRELDILFMIDDTTSGEFQYRFASAAGGFLEQLDASRLDLHIGVATSDLGTSGSLDPDNPAPPIGTVGQGGCAGQGKGGLMTTSFANVSGAFVIDVEQPDGTRTRNYSDPLATTLAQMLRVGVSGCGFEQPLSAIRRALRVNEGFLRTDASLAIVILADEDDCSVRDAQLLDKNEAALGLLTSYYRCTRQGVECDESLDEAGVKRKCRARADSLYVEDPALTKTFLELLERGQERLSVSAIVGPPTPFEVQTVNFNMTPQLGLAPACTIQTATGPQAAHPAERTASFVESFGSRGSLASICQLDYTTAVTRIAMAMKRSLGIACLDTSTLADSLDAPGIQPACEVHDVVERTRRQLPRCPAADDCFDIVTDPQCADLRVVVDRKGPPLPGTRVDVFCDAPTPKWLAI